MRQPGALDKSIVVCAMMVVLALTLAGCDPASLYGPLTGQWSKQTGGYPIAARAAVSANQVYVGGWDGFERSFNELSGDISWSTNLGVTEGDCGGTVYTQGVTSSPWLQNGQAYLGGGGSTWDGLDAATGRVLWTVPTGDNSLTGGHYNWSSPVIFGGEAYVGIASFCDSPLVQGKLLQINLTSHQIDHVFNVVPVGQVGGTIWTNPVIDANSNTVYVATGNAAGAGQVYAQSLVALDATTLAVKSSWQLPASDTTVDADFGTSPVLFTDASGRALVAVTNKNGMLYAFRRNGVAAGPVWQTRISDGVSVSADSGGSFSTGFFDGTALYYASGQTTVAGKDVGGSIRAIDPATGRFLWEHALPAQVYGALDGANGMIVVPSSDGGLYVVRARDGAVLYANALSGAAGASAIFAAPKIADGYVFIGTTDGVVHAFKFPASAASPQVSARTASASATRARTLTAVCAGSRGSSFSATCTLDAPTPHRCVPLGQLPAAVGAVAMDAIAIRSLGGVRARPTPVLLYTNRSCAGVPAVRLVLHDGRVVRRFARVVRLAPGAVGSIRVVRPGRFQVRLNGHGYRMPVDRLAASGRRNFTP